MRPGCGRTGNHYAETATEFCFNREETYPPWQVQRAGAAAPWEELHMRARIGLQPPGTEHGDEAENNEANDFLI